MKASITKNEKFVFLSDFSTRDIAKILLKPDFPRVNLEFKELPIECLLGFTWKAWGHQVKSLKFDQCGWNDDIIKNVVLYCVNMASFKLYLWHDRAGGRNPHNSFCSPRVLDELIEEGVQRTELCTLATLIMDKSVLSDSFVKKILLIYPHIQHFSAGTSSYGEYLDLFGIEKEFVFPTCLSLCTQLRSLKYNFPANGSWMELCTVPESGPGFRSVFLFLFFFSFHSYINRRFSGINYVVIRVCDAG